MPGLVAAMAILSRQGLLDAAAHLTGHISIDKSGTLQDEALQYHMLRDSIARQSLDAGFEKPIEPKAWRRGVGNAANGMFSCTLCRNYSTNHSVRRQGTRCHARSDDAP